MIWLDLLRRLWPYLAGLALIIGGGLYLHHRWYQAGYAASEAHWKPAFEAAQRALTAANERARRMEADSIALSQKVQAEHEKAVASLASRAADAESANRSLVRQLAARSRCVAVPAAGGAAPEPDAASAGDPIADRAAADLTELARRGESDARTLSELQGWIRGQLAILRRSDSAASGGRSDRAR